MTTVARLLGPYENTVPVRTYRRMIAIGGYDRALALSAQAFGALVPAVLVLTSVVSGSQNAAAVVAGFGMSRSAAATSPSSSRSPRREATRR